MGGRRPAANGSRQRRSRSATAAVSAAAAGSTYHQSVCRKAATKAAGSTFRTASHATTPETPSPAAARTYRLDGRGADGGSASSVTDSATETDGHEDLDRLEPVGPGDLLALAV